MYRTEGYVRKPKRTQAPKQYEFINPYPGMSDLESRVFLFLEGLGVPFSWRNFDGQQFAPNFVELLMSYSPEFTLTEYRAVIIIIGSYQGKSVPGMIQNDILAQVLLESDGWKVALLREFDILNDVASAVLKQIPELANNVYRGMPKNFPTESDLAYLERRSQYVASRNFAKRLLLKLDATWEGWSSKRKPKKGDRRKSNKITSETRIEDTSYTGQVRFSGKFAQGTGGFRQKRSTSSNRFYYPNYARPSKKETK
jgi:hypothetical protein